MRIDRDLFERVEEITNTTYKKVDNKEPEEPVYALEIESMIENLIAKIDNLEEQIEDREKDIAENYRRIPINEQVGITDKEFM